MQQTASQASLETLKLLVSNGGSVLHGALISQPSYSHNNGVPDRLDLVRYLLDQSAPIDAFYKESRNEGVMSHETVVFGRQAALHFAIWGGKSDMVKLLLDRGADRNLATCSARKTSGQIT